MFKFYNRFRISTDADMDNDEAIFTAHKNKLIQKVEETYFAKTPINFCTVNNGPIQKFAGAYHLGFS